MFSSTLSKALLCPAGLVLSTFSLLAAEISAPRTIALEECLKRAAERSPDLQAGAYRTEAAAYRAKVAARPPNPKITAESENFSGSGDFSGTRAAESTLSLTQEIELGGKRHSRTEAAKSETDASRAAQGVALQARMLETRRAALALLTAQRKTRLAEEEVALSREIESVATAREKAGKATVLETGRARAETAQALIALEVRRAEQHSAARELAQCWGESEPAFDTLADTPGAQPQDLPPLDALILGAASNPQLLAAEATVRTSQTKTAVERSARVPNLEVGAGMRRFEENGDYAAVASVGVELPLFTRNMDGVRAAEADAEAARLDSVSVRLRIEAQIRQFYAKLAALDTGRRRYDETVLPLAESNLNLMRQAHRQGKAGYLEVLEAQRSLVTARLQHIENEAACAEIRISINNLANNPTQSL